MPGPNGATILTINTDDKSSTNAPALRPALTAAGDPIPLALTELDAVVAAGGPAGANPSRNQPRPSSERA